MFKRLSLTLVTSALVLAMAAGSPASARGGGFGGGFHGGFRGASFGHAFAARPQSFARTGGIRHASFAIARGYPCYSCGHTPPHRPILPPGSTNGPGSNGTECHYGWHANPNMFPPEGICSPQ